MNFNRCSLIPLLSLTEVRFRSLGKQFLRLWISFRFHRIISCLMQLLGANVFFCGPFSHLLQRFLLSTIIMRWNRAWAPQHEAPLQTLTKLNKLFQYFISSNDGGGVAPDGIHEVDDVEAPVHSLRRCKKKGLTWSIWFNLASFSGFCVVSKSGWNYLNLYFFSFVGPSLRVNYLCMFVKLLNTPGLPWPPNWWPWARSPPTGQSGTAGRTGSWPLWK